MIRTKQISVRVPVRLIEIMDRFVDGAIVRSRGHFVLQCLIYGLERRAGCQLIGKALHEEKIAKRTARR